MFDSGSELDEVREKAECQLDWLAHLGTAGFDDIQELAAVWAQPESPLLRYCRKLCIAPDATTHERDSLLHGDTATNSTGVLGVVRSWDCTGRLLEESVPDLNEPESRAAEETQAGKTPGAAGTGLSTGRRLSIQARGLLAGVQAALELAVWKESVPLTDSACACLRACLQSFQELWSLGSAPQPTSTLRLPVGLNLVEPDRSHPGRAARILNEFFLRESDLMISPATVLSGWWLLRYLLGEDSRHSEPVQNEVVQSCEDEITHEFSTSFPILLAGEVNLGTEIEPVGAVGRVIASRLPNAFPVSFVDPVTCGLTVLEQDMCDSIALAWEIIRISLRSHLDEKDLPAIRLAPQSAVVETGDGSSEQRLFLLDGTSAGVAFLLAMYAAAERVTLPDDWAASVAVSRKVSESYRLEDVETGDVGGVRHKLTAAARSGIQNVILTSTQHNEWCSFAKALGRTSGQITVRTHPISGRKGIAAAWRLMTRGQQLAGSASGDQFRDVPPYQKSRYLIFPATLISFALVTAVLIVGKEAAVPELRHLDLFIARDSPHVSGRELNRSQADQIRIVSSGVPRAVNYRSPFFRPVDEDDQLLVEGEFRSPAYWHFVVIDADGFVAVTDTSDGKEKSIRSRSLMNNGNREVTWMLLGSPPCGGNALFLLESTRAITSEELKRRLQSAGPPPLRPYRDRAPQDGSTVGKSDFAGYVRQVEALCGEGVNLLASVHLRNESK